MKKNEQREKWKRKEWRRIRDVIKSLIYNEIFINVILESFSERKLC
jgi:hypothetical protein